MKQLIASFKQVEVLTWQAAFFVCILLVFFGPLFSSLANGTPRANEQNVFLVTSVIYLVFVAVAKATFLSGKKIGEAPIRSLLALVFLCFLASAGSRIISVTFFEQPLTSISPVRLVTTSIAVAIWTLTLALWLGQTKAHKREMQQLESEIHKLAALELQSVQVLKQAQTRTISKIEETLNSAWAKLNPGERVSDQLLEMVNKVVRPLSREIAANEIAEIEAKFNQLISVSFAKRVKRWRSLLGGLSIFDPVYTPVFLVVLPYLSRTLIAEPLGAERSLLISYFLFFLVMKTGQLLERNFRKTWSLNRRIGIAVALWGISATVDAAVFSLLFSRAGFSTFPVIIFANLVVFVLFLTIRLIFEDRRQILLQTQELKEKLNWLNARTKQLIWVEQQRLSNLVHGHMQAQITATALRFEEQDAPNTKGLLQKLHGELEEILANHNRTEPVPLFIESMKLLWGNSIKITSRHSRQVEVVMSKDHEASDAIIEIIREAITNAAKHSRAKNIRINLDLEQTAKPVDLEQGFISLSIENDGAGLSRNFSQGAGLEFFNSVSSSWNLEAVENMVRLTAKVPYSKS